MVEFIGRGWGKLQVPFPPIYLLNSKPLKSASNNVETTSKWAGRDREEDTGQIPDLLLARYEVFIRR